MSQKVIEVTLTVSSNVDVLIFGLDKEHPEAYVVNLNSANSQNELKNVFSRLLQMARKGNRKQHLLPANG